MALRGPGRPGKKETNKDYIILAYSFVHYKVLHYKVWYVFNPEAGQEVNDRHHEAGQAVRICRLHEAREEVHGRHHEAGKEDAGLTASGQEVGHGRRSQTGQARRDGRLTQAGEKIHGGRNEAGQAGGHG